MRPYLHIGVHGPCTQPNILYIVVLAHMYSLYYKIEIHSSCENEYFVETNLCKLCVILRSRVLRVVCPHYLIKDIDRRLLLKLQCSY